VYGDNRDQGFEVGIISFVGLRSKQMVTFDDVKDLLDSVSKMLMYIVVEELGGCGRGTGGCGVHVDRQTRREAVSVQRCHVGEWEVFDQKKRDSGLM
jgi:hypothetical protein